MLSTRTLLVPTLVACVAGAAGCGRADAPPAPAPADAPTAPAAFAIPYPALATRIVTAVQPSRGFYLSHAAHL